MTNKERGKAGASAIAKRREKCRAEGLCYYCDQPIPKEVLERRAKRPWRSVHDQIARLEQKLAAAKAKLKVPRG